MNEPSKKTAKIFEFKPRDPNAPLVEFKMKRYDEHEHGRFLIDERHGTIQCQLCGQFVPAFVAFCIVADQWRRQDWKFRAIKEYNEKQQKKRDTDLLRRIQRQQGQNPSEGV